MRALSLALLFLMTPVSSFNPYWDREGVTFEDPDGCRIVLRNAAWEG